MLITKPMQNVPLPEENRVEGHNMLTHRTGINELLLKILA